MLDITAILGTKAEDSGAWRLNDTDFCYTGGKLYGFDELQSVLADKQAEMEHVKAQLERFQKSPGYTEQSDAERTMDLRIQEIKHQLKMLGGFENMLKNGGIDQDKTAGVLVFDQTGDLHLVSKGDKIGTKEQNVSVTEFVLTHQSNLEVATGREA